MIKVFEIAAIVVLVILLIPVIFIGAKKNSELNKRMAGLFGQYNHKGSSSGARDMSLNLAQKIKAKKNIRAMVIGDETAEKWPATFLNDFDSKYGIKTEAKELSSRGANFF